MKKYTLVFALCGILPFVGDAVAHGYVNQQRPMVKPNVQKSAQTSRKSGGYRNTIINNFYYTEPAAPAYNNDNINQRKPRLDYKYATWTQQEKAEPEQQPVVKQEKKVERETKSSQMRKYFLAHPFFQPLQGKVGSVTDVFYAQNHFNFDLLDATIYSFEPTHNTVHGPVEPILTGKQQTSQLVVKEDVSIGLSDNVALILMAQYDKTKFTFKDWSDGSYSDSSSDSGLNIFGAGLQNRLVDDEKWIMTISGFFQHQKDTANSFIGEFKAGYKINRNTIYGLARLGYSDLIEGDAYGALVKDETGDWLLLSYKQNVNNVFYVEGGAGVFSVIAKHFTLNGELLFGHYDWHEQFSIKGGFGWQPSASFALNLYASTSLFDSAKGKVRKYMKYDINPTGYPTDVNGTPLYTDSKILYTTGDYKIKDYNEWKAGVQAILYF